MAPERTDVEAIRRRMQIYPIGVIVALVVAIVIVALGAVGSEAPATGIGGDYPAFYGAGRLAAAGEWDGLYDFDNQVAAQADLYATDRGPVARFFAYPPQVAWWYQPLAALPYGWSYLVHTLIMGALLAAAIALARPMIPWLKGREILALAAALGFWPMFRGVTGGSNTALTVFLIVAAWRLIEADREFGAGLVLAALLYKPQFAIPLIGLMLLARRKRVVGGAVAGTAVVFGTGMLLQGPGWVGDWIEVAARFGTIDARLNGHSAISFRGVLENAFGAGPTVTTVGWALALATMLALAGMWWRRTPPDLDARLALTMPGLLLLSPHAMSHDGAVALITVAILVGKVTAPRPWLAAIWILGAAQMWIRQLGFSPGFPMLLLIVWWAWRTVGREQQIPEAAMAAG